MDGQNANLQLKISNEGLITEGPTPNVPSFVFNRCFPAIQPINQPTLEVSEYSGNVKNRAAVCHI